MTGKQISALLKAHTHLLHRIAELEADAVVTREAIFTMLDALVPKDGEPYSEKFDKMLNELQRDRLSAATRAAGSLQDAMLDGAE